MKGRNLVHIAFIFPVVILILCVMGCPPMEHGEPNVLLKSLFNMGCQSCEPVEGEGEPVEGEMNEGEGEILEGEPIEGESENEGESPVEGENEGENTEGEGEPVEGEGETVEGELQEGEPVEGELNEGEGEILEGEPIEGESEGEGESPVEGENEGEITEGEGEPVEGESEGETVEGEPAEGEIEPVEGEPVEGEMETETITLPGGVPLVLVRIPAGSFQMGSPDTERNRYSDEGPVHSVTIDYDFYMGKYEVTQQQWLAVMGSWPGTGPSSGHGVGDAYPAYYVSWDDAKNFIAALNTHITNTGQGAATVRLPSEAEWEYTCRANTTTRFYFGDSLSVDDYCEDDGIRSQYMSYCGNNSTYGSKPVGGKLENAFRLHDMSGNLWEWCEDDWHGSYTGSPSNGSAWIDSPRGLVRVLRGGCWNYEALFCRSAGRSFDSPGLRYRVVGFRLAR